MTLTDKTRQIISIYSRNRAVLELVSELNLSQGTKYYEFAIFIDKQRQAPEIFSLKRSPKWATSLILIFALYQGWIISVKQILE
jgi:hypothetical protein